VHEMHVGPIERVAEVRELIQPRFMDSPVVIRAPVASQFPDVIERNPVFPTNAGELIRPACSRQALAKVIDLALRYRDDERVNASRGASHR
jgi:hypothetical protein